jgi:hypothetical protein
MKTLIFIIAFTALTTNTDKLQVVRNYQSQHVIQSNNRFINYKLEFADFVLRNLNQDSKFSYQLLNRDSVDFFIEKMYKEVK